MDWISVGVGELVFVPVGVRVGSSVSVGAIVISMVMLGVARGGDGEGVTSLAVLDAA